MDKKAKLQFELVDVFGAFVKETAEILLDNQELTDRRRAKANASGPFSINGLIGPPRNRYKIQVEVPGYRFTSFFVSAQEKETPDSRVIVLAIDPAKVVRTQFPNFPDLAAEAQTILNQSDQVLGLPNLTGKNLYKSLDDIRRAGFLNIIAKSARTRLSNGRSVLSYFGDPACKLSEVRGDRFFASVPKELREETKNSVADGLFEPAPGLLHRPPEGFEAAGSFKTPDRAGNLQLTFHGGPTGFAMDVDIDDANGFAHIFQLIQNIGGRTHPYNIHQILVRTQEIDPGYRLFVR